jgi:DNA-binding response OmpR family regulator
MSKKKILVADDDAAIVEVMQILLQDQGYEVVTTSRGENIYKMVEENPDMILLDIWMAGINGNDICQKLKADDKTKHIPIIMFSANSETIQKSIECGADGYLAKPFELDELMNIVQKHTN